MKTTPQNKSPKILLVAAKDAFADAFIGLLNDEGWDVNLVESYGQYHDIFSELSTAKYQLLIVTSFTMSKEHMLELIPAVRARCPRLSVLAISSYDDPWFIQALKRVGAHDFVRLPFDKVEVLASIRGILNQSDPSAAQLKLKHEARSEEMIYTYLVAINRDNQFDGGMDKFHDLLGFHFPWSVRLFPNVLAIQTEQRMDEVVDTIHECAERIDRTQPANEELFDSNKSRHRVRLNLKTEDILVCALVEHVILLKDVEKMRCLEEMLHRAGHWKKDQFDGP